MIRSTLSRLPLIKRARRTREAARGIRSDVILPLDMFEQIRTADEVKAARKLERIYHQGQHKVWNGKEVLSELLERHGGIDMEPERAHALAEIFAVILWGELAAWKISAQLALELEPLEAKMAATSQVHDEARHFYVMYDYLTELGHVPTKLGPCTEAVLSGVLTAPGLAQRLVGMQLMIEPMALTLFHTVRRSAEEPVLSDLLAYYERDEARHVALGILHLPKLLKGLTLPEAIRFWSWQFGEFWKQLDMIKELQPHFDVLGWDVRSIVELGRDKQVRAFKAMMNELGYEIPIQRLFLKFFDMRLAWDYPDPLVEESSLDRMLFALSRAWDGQEMRGGPLVVPIGR